MFIDENDVRTPRERVDGDLLRHLAEAQSRSVMASAREVQRARSGGMSPCDGCCDRNETRGGLNCRGEYGMDGVSLAMVYSPYQHWRNVYSEEKGFCRGTIFRDLDKPFEASGSKGGCC